MSVHDEYAYPRASELSQRSGLTKRELFAAMAMVEIISMAPSVGAALGNRKACAEAAVQYADALLEALS